MNDKKLLETLLNNLRYQESNDLMDQGRGELAIELITEFFGDDDSDIVSQEQSEAPSIYDHLSTSYCDAIKR